MNLHTFYINAISSGLRRDAAEVLLGDFDEERRADTVHAKRGEAYAFARGVTMDFPGNSVFGSDQAWDCVIRLLDRVCEWMHDDGTWSWYLPTTKKTHTINYSWSLLYWMRLVEDFGDRLGSERCGRLDRMFRATLSSRYNAAKRYLIDPLSKSTSLNIFTHWILELWYGGRLLDESEWEGIGEEVMRQIISLQFVDGYWPDSNVHRGPVGNYNIITLWGVSTYALYSNDRSALEAVRRAADYHFYLSYPDGSCVETVDERNRHHVGTVNPKLVCSLAPFPETRPYAAHFAERLMANMAPAELDVGGAAPFCDTLHAVPDSEVVPLGRGDFRREFATIPALVERRGPWYACLSGATTDVPGGMFHHDLQNHLSIWHDDAGLVIGGGNSLHDPPFSSFRFDSCYLAGGGEVAVVDGVCSLRLRYGEIEAHVEVILVDDYTIAIRACSQGHLPADSEFAVHLPGRFGEACRTSYGDVPMDDRSIYRAGGGDAGDFSVGALTFASQSLWRIEWPQTPVNIYNLPLRLPVESAVMRLAARLEGKPVEVRITIGRGERG